MLVTQQPQFLNNANIRYYKSASNTQRTYQPQFSGVSSKASSVISNKYDNFTEWIANNYYKKFYNSKFAKSFIEHTKGNPHVSIRFYANFRYVRCKNFGK